MRNALLEHSLIVANNANYVTRLVVHALDRILINVVDAKKDIYCRMEILVNLDVSKENTYQKENV